ncbi:oligoendopeptidase F [Roseburia sp. 499]|uniref:oligoendopeptidase F n=1 Tax=Roseburia sp. 499 TaxID=1261634 RepID=UPI000952CDCF|nr:oligoendopeptidase F [Roseburia sp. 499]WVK71117.1 oligoendopeptidase F [Roseburia sp. 499]
MAKELLKREQVAVEDTWAIEDIYATEEAFLADADKVEKMSEELEKFTESYLSESGIHLLEYYKKLEEIYIVIDKVLGYAERNADVDTSNTHYQALDGKVVTLYYKLQELTAPIDSYIVAMDDAKIAQFFKDVPELENYKVTIEDVRRLKPHTLSSEMEALLAATSDMGSAVDKVYGLLENADFENPTVKDEKGEMVKVSSGRFVPMLESKDVRVRRDTFKAYYARYEQYKNTFASLYEGKAKSNFFYAKARKYSSSMEAAVDANNVPKEVYYNLIEAVNENMDYLHQYMKLRKKLLGVDELHMYDVYTPMVEQEEGEITYAMAQEEIAEALKVLGDDYVSVLKQGFENRWIDKYENEGKRSGAYSAGNYSTHPFVLMNFQYNLDSEFTLAHEMGHALHSYYSSKNNNIFDSDYKIFVAEVASTCNEALLMDYLLKKTTDKRKKAYLINHFLEQFRTTLYRQTMFAEFELRTHEMVEKGEALTADVLKKVYYDLNKKYYGNDMVVDEEIAIEWARIPHFYYNFYVYQYATSFSASMAISKMILEEGKPAVDRYLKFLSGGCTKSPIDLLKDAGVDMTTKKPISDALKTFGELIQEMDQLV